LSESPRVWNKSRSRSVPADAVYVGRGTPWGNPFKIGVHGSRAQVVYRFKMEVLPSLDVSELRGKDLVCHCVPEDCHANYLLEKANQ
jgi:hypothetical protein